MTTHLAGCVLCLALAVSPVAAQSLGQVAADEAARRKTIATPARVIRADDLRTDFPVTTPVERPAWPGADTAAADPQAPRTLVAAASLQGGGLPPIAAMAVAGGEVFLELTVNRDGGVEAVRTLRDTPPFTDSLSMTVRGWRFAPAEDVLTPAVGQRADETTRRATSSKVLVVGLFRPPALFAMTLGEPPKTIAGPSDDAPAVTGAATMPLYPARAMFDGTALIELQLGVDGSVMRTRLARSAPGFDEPALDAAAALSFRAPRVKGRAVPSVVYVVEAFRQPITP